MRAPARGGTDGRQRISHDDAGAQGMKGAGAPRRSGTHVAFSSTSISAVDLTVFCLEDDGGDTVRRRRGGGGARGRAPPPARAVPATTDEGRSHAGRPDPAPRQQRREVGDGHRPVLVRGVGVAVGGADVRRDGPQFHHQGI